MSRTELALGNVQVCEPDSVGTRQRPGGRTRAQGARRANFGLFGVPGRFSPALVGTWCTYLWGISRVHGPHSGEVVTKKPWGKLSIADVIKADLFANGMDRAGLRVALHERTDKAKVILYKLPFALSIVCGRYYSRVLGALVPSLVPGGWDP